MKTNKKRKAFSFLITKWDGSPRFEAFRFVVGYIIIGVLWILFSDTLLRVFMSDQQAISNAQLIKGMFYVFATGGLFYFILKARLQALRKLSQTLMYQATHDSLTGIPIKVEFGRRLNEKIKTNKHQNHIALAYLDVDNFSSINELMDYSVGDELLIAIKDALSNHLSKKELKGRDGGGFVFTITYPAHQIQHVNQCLDEILSMMNTPWIIKNNRLSITCSIGVALYPKDGKNFYELYRAADIVMHDVKENNKNTYTYFDKEYVIKRHDRINMIHELKQAIEDQQLSLVYQPIYSIQNQQVAGYEALLRWESQTYGLVSPSVFIPYSENIGMFLKIEAWVFEQAMLMIKEWETKGYHSLVLSVNLSSSGLNSPELIEQIVRMQQLYNINPKQLQIEVTETALIVDIECAIKHLHKLKVMGCSIALDDFGSGYSSLMYLQKLPIDTVKLDKIFINKIKDNVKEDVVFDHIIVLLKELGLEIVVEGIENQQQHEFVKKMKDVFIQGYYYSYPFVKEAMMQHISLYVPLVQK